MMEQDIPTLVAGLVDKLCKPSDVLHGAATTGLQDSSLLLEKWYKHKKRVVVQSFEHLLDVKDEVRVHINLYKGETDSSTVFPLFVWFIMDMLHVRVRV